MSKNLIEDPKILGVPSKEKELINHVSTVKTKKFDSETRAIIDLLHTQVIDRLEAEKSGR